MLDWQVIVVALAKFFVFAIFIMAIIEVVKGVAIKGVFGLIKELIFVLGVNAPISTDSIKILTFVIALLYCRVFDYGVMSNVLQVDFTGRAFASFLDYIGSASLVYTGTDWVFAQFKALKSKLDDVKKELVNG